jgi:hypothetical protein
VLGSIFFTGQNFQPLHFKPMNSHRRSRLSRQAASLLALSLAFAIALPGAAQTPSPPVVYTSAQLDKSPELKRKVRVKYPSVVKQGDQISLRFIVTKEGRVTEMIIATFTNPDMVGPASEAYEKARFTPGTKGGKPVDAWFEVTDIAR